MSDTRTARAVVSVVVEVTESAWGPDCTIAQAESQAIASAIARLRRLFNDDRSVNVLRIVGTEVRLACVTKEGA